MSSPMASERSSGKSGKKGGMRSAKKLLDVLRTTLMGTHLLLKREVVTDVSTLPTCYGLDDAMELVEQKRRGEKADLSACWRGPVVSHDRVDTVRVRDENGGGLMNLRLRPQEAA
jgi:hypothetical protein